jgi:hypothetical protein
MAESKPRTKRKVNLVSSHSDNDNKDGPLVAIIDDGSAVSALYTDDRIPSLCDISQEQDKQWCMKKSIFQTSID